MKGFALDLFLNRLFSINQFIYPRARWDWISDGRWPSGNRAVTDDIAAVGEPVLACRHQ
jgi:hypothetical protein